MMNLNAVQGLSSTYRQQRQLLDLNDRMLNDIGLTRAEIRKVGSQVELGVLLGSFVKTAKAWFKRRAVHNELSGLSDRMLVDIGISRSEISAIAYRGKIRQPVMHAPISLATLRQPAVASTPAQIDEAHYLAA